MSRQINQPINQVKLTNVAVVRCNRHGKRFEIACYRNKVMDYRAGLETDLSEVLQTERIFTNVSKGQFAKASDLEQAFGTRNQDDIAKLILDQASSSDAAGGGNWQVSDLERAQSIKDTLSQIATWVAANCVHADTNVPYTPSQIKHALGKNYTVHPQKSIKKQCLDAVRFLKTQIPIERAKMRLQLSYTTTSATDDDDDAVQAALQTHPHRLVRQETTADNLTMVVLDVDPSLYREFSELMSQVDAGSLEILEQVVMSQQGDINLEQQQQQLQLQNKQQQQEEEDKPKTSTPDDDPDSDVENLVKQLQSNIHGTDEDDDEPHRKQNKNRKKSKKEKRREQEAERERQQLAAQQQQQTTTPAGPACTHVSAPPAAAAGAKSCNTCGGAFATAADYRAHFKSDWHRFNQKLKLKGVPAVSEQEFLLCDADTFFGSGSDLA